MGALLTLTDIPSLYSTSLVFVLLTPGILTVHLYIASRCPFLLLSYDPVLGRPSATVFSQQLLQPTLDYAPRFVYAHLG